MESHRSLQDDDDDVVGVVLFGLGRAGTIHIGNIIRNPRMELLYIVELDVQKASDAKRKHRLVNTTILSSDSYQQALEDPRVHAAVVCTPTFTHEDIVNAALEQDKSVFCEKPIADDLARTKACCEAAEKRGKHLFCSFNRRFDPSVALLKSQLEEGKVGNVHTIRTCSRDSPVPTLEYLRISGGIFHDCAVHDIDMICWLLGSYPQSVYCTAHAHNDDIAAMDDVDTVNIVMKFKSNVIASIDLSRFATFGYDQRVEVFGSAGMLISENQRPTEMTSYTSSGCLKPPFQYSFPQRYADSYVLALDHFLDAVKGVTKLDVTKQNILKVSTIASACEESHRTGTVITLDLDRDL